MAEFAIDFFFILGLMCLGEWLESIGGINGWVDRFLTPLPLGISGGVIVIVERVLA